MIPPRHARDLVVHAAAPLPPRALPIVEALGCALAAPLRAATTLPPYDVSAMDGYAVPAGAVGPGGGTLRVLGEVTVRDAFAGAIRDGEAVAISTGGRVPGGAAAIVPIERTRPGDDPDEIVFEGPILEGAHIRRRGEELTPGALLLPDGAVLDPPAIGLLGALGIAEIDVHAPPRVAVIVTGEEFADGPSTRGPARDANGPLLLAALATLGVHAVTLQHVGDSPSALSAALSGALDVSDVVISTGGASVGPHDHVVAAWDRAGVAPFFHKVSMKPGKPTHVGRAARPGREAFVFALPGNPLAVWTTFELFIAPVIEALSGRDDGGGATVTARLTRDVRRDPRAQFLRVALREGDDGLVAEPSPAQGSGMLRGAATCPWVTCLRPGAGVVAAGTPLPFGRRAGVAWEPDAP